MFVVSRKVTTWSRFLERIQEVLSYSRNSLYFMESEGSLECSQQPATFILGQINLLRDCPHHYSSINCLLRLYVLRTIFVLESRQQPIMSSPSSHAFHMPRFHFSWFNNLKKYLTSSKYFWYQSRKIKNWIK